MALHNPDLITDVPCCHKKGAPFITLLTVLFPSLDSIVQFRMDPVNWHAFQSGHPGSSLAAASYEGHCLSTTADVPLIPSPEPSVGTLRSSSPSSAVLAPRTTLTLYDHWDDNSKQNRNPSFFHASGTCPHTTRM